MTGVDAGVRERAHLRLDDHGSSGRGLLLAEWLSRTDKKKDGPPPPPPHVIIIL